MKSWWQHIPQALKRRQEVRLKCYSHSQTDSINPMNSFLFPYLKTSETHLWEFVSTGSLLKCPQKSGPGQAKAGHQNSIQVSHVSDRWPKYVSHHPLPPRLCLDTMLAAGLQCRHSAVTCSYRGWRLNCGANAGPYLRIVSVTDIIITLNSSKKVFGCWFESRLLLLLASSLANGPNP